MSTALAIIKPITVSYRLDPLAEPTVSVFDFGMTLDEMLGGAGVEPQKGKPLGVTVDGCAVPIEEWTTLRPDAGACIDVSHVPGFFALFALLAGPAAVGVTTVAGAFAASFGWALVAGLISVIGGIATSFLLSTIVKAIVGSPSQANIDLGTSGLSPTIRGAENQFYPNGPVWINLGTNRYTFPLGALAQTEVLGGAQNLRMLFHVSEGWQSIPIDKLRIGDSGLDSKEDIEYVVHDGTGRWDHYHPDGTIERWSDAGESAYDHLKPPVMRLFLGDVQQDFLTQAYDPEFGMDTITSGAQTLTQEAEEIGVELEFPNGLRRIDDLGGKIGFSVRLNIQVRKPTGTNTWLDVTLLPDWYKNSNELVTIRELDEDVTISSDFDVVAQFVYYVKVRNGYASYQTSYYGGEYKDRIIDLPRLNGGLNGGFTGSDFIKVGFNDASPLFEGKTVRLYLFRRHGSFPKDGFFRNSRFRATNLPGEPTDMWFRIAAVDNLTPSPLPGGIGIFDRDEKHLNIVAIEHEDGTPYLNADGTPYIPASTVSPIAGGTAVFDADVPIGTFVVEGNTHEQILLGLNFKAPEGRGIYQVKVDMLNNDGFETIDRYDTNHGGTGENSSGNRANMNWTSMKATLYDVNAVRRPGHSLIEMRIRATDQLNGVIKNFNGIPTSMLPTYLPNPGEDAGTAETHAGTDTLKDNFTWDVDEWIDRYVTIRAGDADEETRLIVSNTVDVLTVVRDWDSKPLTGDPYLISPWKYLPTSNPAWCALYALQGEGAKRKIPTDRINLTEWVDWADYCTSEGLEYNRVHDFDSTQLTEWQNIASVGHASASRVGGTYTVIVDKPQSIYRQKWSPINVSGFRWERSFTDVPNAIRVKFRNKTGDRYQLDERVVYRDGYAELDAYISATATVSLDPVSGAQRFEMATDLDRVGVRAGWFTVGAASTGDWVPFIGDIILVDSVSVVSSTLSYVYTVGDGSEIPADTETGNLELTMVAARTFETFETLGVTDATQAYNEARWRYAIGKLRPEIMSWSTGWENILSRRGDLCRLSHWIIKVGSGWGRVESWTAPISDIETVTISHSAKFLLSLTSGTDSGATGYSMRIRRGDTLTTDLYPIENAADQQTPYWSGTIGTVFSNIIAPAINPAWSVNEVQGKYVIIEHGESDQLAYLIVTNGVSTMTVSANAAAAGASIADTLRIVDLAEISTNVLVLDPPVASGTLVDPTDIGMSVTVGETGIESMDVILTSISYLDDNQANISAVPYSPAIYDELTAPLPAFITKISQHSIPKFQEPSSPKFISVSPRTILPEFGDGVPLTALEFIFAARPSGNKTLYSGDVELYPVGIASVDISAGVEEITLDAVHGFAMGQKVQLIEGVGGTVPGGTTEGLDYYLGISSTTEITLYLSKADALSDSARVNLGAGFVTPVQLLVPRALTDTDASWTVDQFAGEWVTLRPGLTTEERIKIISNTSKTIIVESDWVIAPVVADLFDIQQAENTTAAARIEFQYRIAGDSGVSAGSWTTLGTSDPDETSFLSKPISTNDPVDTRIRSISAFGIPSSWVVKYTMPMSGSVAKPINLSFAQDHKVGPTGVRSVLRVLWEYPTGSVDLDGLVIGSADRFYIAVSYNGGRQNGQFVGTTFFDVLDAFPGWYEVEISAVVDGIRSDVERIRFYFTGTNLFDIPKVSGLRIRGGDPLSNEFTGANVSIEWTPVFLSATGAMRILDQWGLLGEQDNLIKGYLVEISDPITGEFVAKYPVFDNERFDYTLDMNVRDSVAIASPARRSLLFSVVALDVFGNPGDDPSVILATNPAPATPTVTVTTGANKIFFDFNGTAQEDPDFAYYAVWGINTGLDTDSTFGIGDCIAANRVGTASGASGFLALDGLTEGDKWVFRTAGFDEFSARLDSTGFVTFSDVNISARAFVAVDGAVQDNGILHSGNAAGVADASGLQQLQDDNTLIGRLFPSNSYLEFVPHSDETNTTTSSTDNTLTRTGAGWDATGSGEWAGHQVIIRKGSGFTGATPEEQRLILSNTTDTLTVDRDWFTNPSSATYDILEFPIPTYVGIPYRITSKARTSNDISFTKEGTVDWLDLADGKPAANRDYIVYTSGAGPGAITDSSIRTLFADTIIGGTIVATIGLGVGGQTFIDGKESNIVITDEQGSPVERVKIGKLGAGVEDYGVVLKDSKGRTSFDADGHGLGSVSRKAIVGQLNQLEDASFENLLIGDFYSTPGGATAGAWSIVNADPTNAYRGNSYLKFTATSFSTGADAVFAFNGQSGLADPTGQVLVEPGEFVFFHGWSNHIADDTTAANRTTGYIVIEFRDIDGSIVGTKVEQILTTAVPSGWIETPDILDMAGIRAQAPADSHYVTFYIRIAMHASNDEAVEWRFDSFYAGREKSGRDIGVGATTAYTKTDKSGFSQQTSFLNADGTTLHVPLHSEWEQTIETILRTDNLGAGADDAGPILFYFQGGGSLRNLSASDQSLIVSAANFTLQYNTTTEPIEAMGQVINVPSWEKTFAADSVYTNSGSLFGFWIYVHSGLASLSNVRPILSLTVTQITDPNNVTLELLWTGKFHSLYFKK